MTTSNFSKTALVFPTLTVDTTRPSLGDKKIIRDQRGVAVAVAYAQDGYLDVELDSISRYCLTIDDALYFTAAVLTGEWAAVSAGEVESPIARVEF